MISNIKSLKLPSGAGLGLKRIANASGIEISALPNGCIHAIEHFEARGRIMVNQVLGSPLDGGISRLYVRTDQPSLLQAVGPKAVVRFGADADRFVWEGLTQGLRLRTTLWLPPGRSLWVWRLEITNESDAPLQTDAILVQDIGLADRDFLMSNEAFASQYIDHSIAYHPRRGPIILSRQNLDQGGRHPWVAHGCFERCKSFATDALQIFGPSYRDCEEVALPFGRDLPGERLQHEAACVALQTEKASLRPGDTARFTFFAIFEPDHAPSSESDLARIDAAFDAAERFEAAPLPLHVPDRSILQDAATLALDSQTDNIVRSQFAVHEERRDGRLLSFFCGDGLFNRHFVLGEKELLMRRRHGAILRSGQSLLPDEDTLCATCWMHGVFASQVAVGDTSFHKLFSVSRDPYNITRSSGLRILVELSGRWRLLTVPALFEMGLSDCRWVYRIESGTITVHVFVSGEDPALQVDVAVEGTACRFLIFGHVVLGQNEEMQGAELEIDRQRASISLRPDSISEWGRRYPHALFQIISSTSEIIEAMGGDELLYANGLSSGSPFIAIRTKPTNRFNLTVFATLNDAGSAHRLAAKYERGVSPDVTLDSAAKYWSRVIGNVALKGADEASAGFRTIFPWLVHDAVVHLTAPHGLEQYSTGTSWGTRDVCQGPVEFLLAFGHTETVKEILRRVFARQYLPDGDWPQWFMLPPYSGIQEPHSHGDIIIWPLKALCDYLEHTQDFAFLDEAVGWWSRQQSQPASGRDSVFAHVRKLLAKVKGSFISGTHLPRYGQGDWNDTLQPADPMLKDRMSSSWTAALLFQQLRRYARLLAKIDEGEANSLDLLADAVRADFNRYLIQDGVVAGYAIFEHGKSEPRLLLHPSDRLTGVSYSLIPMTCAISGGLFTEDQARHHLDLIRKHLLFPDGVRLMDRPLPYHGGEERIFRRGESAAFFGREVGLMYVHAHLRYCEALAAMNEWEELKGALMKVNPVTVNDLIPNASLRQRNSYFSSSDAAFRDRYQALDQWNRVSDATIPVDGGWRIYSGGPGLFLKLLKDAQAHWDGG